MACLVQAIFLIIHITHQITKSRIKRVIKIDKKLDRATKHTIAAVIIAFY